MGQSRETPGHFDGSIAIVHEWIAARAGSELVFERLAQQFPDADLYALSRDPQVAIDTGGRSIRTTFLDRTSVLRNRRAATLGAMPMAWRRLGRATKYDCVITSSHAFAREFVGDSDCLHLNYIHSPMRYAWNPELDQRMGPMATLLSSPARAALRRLDKRSVEGTHAFAVNSRAVAERVAGHYGVRADVIHPPVDVSYFAAVDAPRKDYLLAASRWVPYKRLDLAIEVARRLDLELVIAGSGPESHRLASLASQARPGQVRLIHQPSRAVLRQLMAQAAAFLFPAHEDFGIIAVEAQAAGTPVVALRAGGAVDTVIDGITGALADDQSVEAFVAATERCLALPDSADACRSNSLVFGHDAFATAVSAWFDANVARHSGSGTEHRVIGSAAGAVWHSRSA